MTRLKIKSSVLCAVAALAGSFPILVPTSPSPAAGPGGVVIAVRDFLKAVDAGEAGPGFCVPRGAIALDGALKVVKGADAPAMFDDVGPDGTPLQARTPAAFCKLLNGTMGTSKAAGRTLVTEVRAVQADCPSPGCSWAVVDFDRTYVTAGQKMVQHLRATALLRHDGESFQMFHWHAGLRPEGARPLQKKQ